MNRRLRDAVRLALFCVAAVSGAGAEDIDIYTTGQSASDAANVLFFIDNTSNWSANNQKWEKASVAAKCGSDATCLGYVNQVFGTADGLLQGQVELRALKLVLQELTCGTSSPFRINLGLMLLANTANSGTVDGSSVTSGYIRRAIKSSSEACPGLLADLDYIDAKIQDPDFKTSSSADYGTALFEAFKYFGGYANTNGVEAQTQGTPQGARGFGATRYSVVNSFEDASAFTDELKGTYKSPIDEEYCGQNYIILIGNGHPNQEYGSDQNATPPTNQLMGYLGLQPRQLYSVSNKSDIRFADEWSAFLARTDVNAASGQQTVKTYTINVYKQTEDLKQTALLSSMAKNGGTGVAGAYNVGGDLKALVDALKKALMQIASVNSAFASAALPISTNTQGTYLNQVFIGMFRPDLPPRWAGNLKQYEFALRTTTTAGVVTRDLFLADADGEPAVDNATTGFLRDCARSFWTTSSGTYWSSVPGAQESGCTAISQAPYSDSPDGPIVERGAAAQRIRSKSPSTRVIHTCAAAPDACTSTAMTGTSALENWIRGQNIGDGPVDSNGNYQTYGKSTTDMRPTVHGGVVHSRPLALSYGTGEDEVVVFYGSDDGLLRAVNGSKTAATGGDELWAFLAPEFTSKLQRLRDNSPVIEFATNKGQDGTAPKDYFFDGSIGAYVGPDPDDATERVTYIYPSMRRGGRMVYAFNASTHPSESAPTPMWRFGCPSDDDTDCVGTDAASLGQTWSTPRAIRVKEASGDSFTSKLYVVFGGGYDSCEDSEPRNCPSTSKGRGIFFLNAKTGVSEKYIDLGAGAGRVVADVVPMDTDGDRYTDLLYAVDTAGNVWRVNIGQGAPTAWTVTHVAKVADWSSVNVRNRKFLYAPGVIAIGSYNVVLVGTGDREKPLYDAEAAGVDTARVKNRFYGFWDNRATGSSYTLIDDSADCDAPGDTVLSTGCQVMNTSDTSLDYNQVFFDPANRPRGWTIDLDDYSTNGPNEQVVTNPAIIGGQVFFSTFQATKPRATGRVCSALGTARGYSACFLHGGAVCGTPVAGVDLVRSTEFVGGGIPPSPVAGLVQVEGDDGHSTTVPFCIGCKGEEPDCASNSALEGCKIKIPISKDRVKTYRYKFVD